LDLFGKLGNAQRLKTLKKSARSENITPSLNVITLPKPNCSLGYLGHGNRRRTAWKWHTSQPTDLSTRGVEKLRVFVPVAVAIEAMQEERLARTRFAQTPLAKVTEVKVLVEFGVCIGETALVMENAVQCPAGKQRAPPATS